MKKSKAKKINVQMNGNRSGNGNGVGNSKTLNKWQ